MGCLSLLSFWDVLPQPSVPLGYPDLKVMVASNLYDPATAYQNAQRMVQAFPRSFFLTNQAVGHAVTSYYDFASGNECVNHLARPL